MKNINDQEKTLTRRMQTLRTNQDKFVIEARQADIIKNLGLSSKNTIRQTITRSSDGNQIPIYITLCPFYDGNGGIKGDYERFEDIGQRYQKKFQASMEVLVFLAENIGNLDIRFLLADQGILLRNSYNITNLKNDLSGITQIYSDKIAFILGSQNFSLQNFSDIGLNLEQTADLEKQYTVDDINNLLEEYGINPDKFTNNLDIIIRAFKMTGAYYLVRNYLQENQQLADIMNGVIFLNTEAVSPLNGLYTAGNIKINQNNLFARVDI